MSENVLPQISSLKVKELPNGEDVFQKPASLEEHVRWLQVELYRVSKWEDDYGIPGSSWDVCSYCGQEDRPGVLSFGGVPHLPECPLHPIKFEK